LRTNPSQITPHREKTDHSTVLFDHAERGDTVSSVQPCPHPTWEVSLRLPRISLFSSVVTLMAFAQETKSFGSHVQDQTLTLTKLWLTFKPKPCLTSARLCLGGFVLPTKKIKSYPIIFT